MSGDLYSRFGGTQAEFMLSAQLFGALIEMISNNTALPGAQTACPHTRPRRMFPLHRVRAPACLPV